MPIRKHTSLVVFLLTALLIGCASDQVTPIKVVTLRSGAGQAISHMPPCRPTTPESNVEDHLPVDHPKVIGAYLWQQIPQPTYPTKAQQRGWQGDVLICLVFLKDGTITEAKVHQSSGFPLLDNNALDAVQSMKRLNLDLDLHRPEYSAVIPFRYHLQPMTEHQHKIAVYVWACLTAQAAKPSQLIGLASAQSGTVIMRVTLRTNGEVEEIKLDESSGWDLLDQTATKLVMDCSPYPLNSSDAHKPTVFVVPFSYSIR